MFLYSRIRYFDRRDREFKDRLLFLDTTSLDAVNRAAIELIAEDQVLKRRRDVLKFRYLFQIDDGKSFSAAARKSGSFSHVGPMEYIEDECGVEISPQELGVLLTGDPNALAVPHGAQQHDIDLMLARPTTIPIEEVRLDGDQIRILGYFVRDLDELQNSAFMRDGPGTLQMTGLPPLSEMNSPLLKTAATDDEIRSFVTVFRRLYMPSEPANFKNAVALFGHALNGHPYANWVAGVFNEFETNLNLAPDFTPLVAQGAIEFTGKRLIDVFLYTQYAHQPDKRRQRQFQECLTAAHEKLSVLTWMFLSQMWARSLEIVSAGRVIDDWFKKYCDHHKVLPDVLGSLRKDELGFGEIEKKATRSARLLDEKIEQLAIELHRQHGSPASGHAAFLTAAREQLSKVMKS